MLSSDGLVLEIVTRWHQFDRLDTPHAHPQDNLHNLHLGFRVDGIDLPAGVPAWLANAPVLGSALRGVVVRSAQRMIEDIEAVLRQVDHTNDIHQVLRRAASKGHAKDAEKKAQAQRKQDKAREAGERKKSGTGGRFL